MTFRIFMTPRAEQAVLGEIEQRFARFADMQAQAAADPEMGRRLAEHSRAYARLARPGVVTGMALAGMEADSPQSRALVEHAAQRRMQAEAVRPQVGETVQASTLGAMARTFTRGMFTGLSAPFQEASRLVVAAGDAALTDGTFAEAYADTAPSTLALAWRSAADGGSLPWRGSEDHLGTGWLPAGGVERERVAIEGANLGPDGQHLTPGRLIPMGLNAAAGRVVIEPGTKPYSLVSGLGDFAANIGLDPLTYVGGGFAKAGKAVRTFGVSPEDIGAWGRAMAASGLVPGARKGAIGESVVEFLGRAQGQAVMERIADLDSPSVIFRGFGGKIDRETAVALADASDLGAVEGVLRDVLGSTVKAKPSARQFNDTTLGTRTYANPLAPAPDTSFLFEPSAAPYRDRVPAFRRSLHGLRMTQDMPSQILDLNDTRQTAQTFDAYLRNAKLPDDVVRSLTDDLLRTDPLDVEEVSSIVTRANEQIMRDLIDVRGTAPGKARQLTSVMAGQWAAYARDARQYLMSRTGQPILPPGRKAFMEIDGERVDLSGGVAAMLVHARSDAVFLPDVRALRREASWLRGLWDTPVIGGMSSGAVNLLGSFTQAFWKPLQLIRPAIMLRVLPEEQARMAAHGDVSLLTHPAQYLAYVTGRRGLVSPGGGETRAATDYLSAMSARYSEVVSGEAIPRSFFSGDFVKGYKGQAGDTGWWAGYLGRFAVDPIASEVAGTMAGAIGRTWDELRHAFRDGDLRELREQAARQLNLPALRNPDGADSYLERLREALIDATGGDFAAGRNGDAELLSAIYAGRFGDAAVAPRGARESLDVTPPALSRPVTGVGSHEVVPFGDKQVTSWLDERRALMPPVMPRPRRATEAGGAQAEGPLSRMVDVGFETFMSRPTDRFSRSPAYMGSMWKEAERLLAYSTPDVQKVIIENARKANLNKGTIKRMQARAARGSDGALRSAAHVDRLAHATALDETRDLLYDVSKRSQFSDVLRIIAPFAEPWKEILTTWTRLVGENPLVTRRAQQLIEGARGADLDGDGQGFFYQDPSSGEEMFCVDEATQALTRRGWVGRADLTTNDAILTLDPETDAIAWQPVLDVYMFEHEGELTRWKGAGVDALTTASHRWLVEDTGRKKGREPRREFKTTEWLSRQEQRPIIVSGGRPEAFASFATFTDEFVELMGWVITEGCYDRRGGYQGITVTQSQRVNPEHTERIRRLVKHYADTGATATEQAQRRDGECTFYLGNGIASLIHHEAPNKEIAPEFLTLLTEPQARLLLKTLIGGDGHTRLNGHRVWFQKDEGRTSGFQMLLAMLGIGSTAKWYGEKHQVWLRNAAHAFRVNAQPEQHRGIVWCPRTPTGTWLARRNGKTYWTGNSYPGGHLLTRLLGGRLGEVKLTGRVEGLNLVGGSLLPGFGPVISIAASQLIPERPELEGFRELLFPFGEPDTDTPGAVLDSLLPAYMRRAVTALRADPEADRVFGNTVVDVMRSLAASGEYGEDEFGMLTRDAQLELEADALNYAKRLYWLRAIAQSTLPAGPVPQFSADTPEGVLTFDALAREYRAMADDVEAGGSDTAMERFVERFGFAPALVTQAKSKQVRYRPLDEMGAKWERRNQDVVKRFRNVAGYFAPSDPDGLFDSKAYERSLELGDRVTLSPEEVLLLHNNTLGRLAMQQATTQLGEGATTAEGRAMLATIRVGLREEYPGFQTTVGIPRGADTAALISELAEAITHPSLAGHPAVPAIREYMDARATATAAAQQIDGSVKSFGQARKAAPVREWLRSRADELMRANPEFAPFWDRIFIRELADDEPMQEVAV